MLFKLEPPTLQHHLFNALSMLKSKTSILAYLPIMMSTTNKCHTWIPTITSTSKLFTNGNKTHKTTDQLIPSGAHSTLSQCIGKLEIIQPSSPGPMALLWMSSGVTRITTLTCSNISAKWTQTHHQAHQSQA